MVLKYIKIHRILYFFTILRKSRRPFIFLGLRHYLRNRMALLDIRNNFTSFSIKMPYER
nr:MAG TPA: hypothetical protein [Caudoviricetes sp.]